MNSVHSGAAHSMPGLTPTCPPSLTQGIPDPTSIEQQKEAYSRSLEEQTHQGKELLITQQKQQTELIHQSAEVQKRQLISQIEEQAKQQELLLSQKYSTQLIDLEQQCIKQKAALEKQANDLTMEYNFRKSKEELLQREYHQRQVQFEEMMRQQPKKWLYNPEVKAPLDIRASPDIDGARTSTYLEEGEVFEVSEEQTSDSGTLYLKLADGRGWVFDKKPGVGQMCSQLPAGAPSQHALAGGSPFLSRGILSVPGNSSVSPPGQFLPVPGGSYVPPPRPPTMWLHQPEFVAPLGIREVPDINGPRTGGVLMPGEVFAVSEELEGPGEILYLKLADGSGWVFDRKPGVGSMCVRHVPPTPTPIVGAFTAPGALRSAGPAPLGTLPALVAPGGSYVPPVLGGSGMPTVVPGGSYVPSVVPGGSYVPPLAAPGQGQVLGGSFSIPSQVHGGGWPNGSIPTTTVGAVPLSARSAMPPPSQMALPVASAPTQALPPVQCNSAAYAGTSMPLPTGSAAPRLLGTRVTVFR
jgi:hypothetical protein